LITPSWLTPDAAPEDLVIELDPGMAFGSGLHPSTRLCLTLLEQHLRPGDSVLDLGTGSGILAIAAAKLGAASVLARDVDLLAVEVAQENVEHNGVSGVVRVEAGSLPQNHPPPMQGARPDDRSSQGTIARQPNWDLILVNILADVIVDLLAQGLDALMVPGGRLVLSGIISTREQEVDDALHRNGLTIAQRRHEGDWVALLAESQMADT
jgi:ribosomal protein L11 methyltransferase